MMQVLTDTDQPCSDDVLARYAFSFHIQYTGQCAIAELLETSKEDSACLVWIYITAIFSDF
jgi:hypothetical protein